MVIRMPLEVEQEQIGQQIIAVPAVRRRHPLKSTILLDTAMQPIVLQVVDDLQRKGRKETLPQEKHQPGPAKGNRKANRKERGNGVPPDQFIGGAIGTLTLATEFWPPASRHS